MENLRAKFNTLTKLRPETTPTSDQNLPLKQIIEKAGRKILSGWNDLSQTQEFTQQEDELFLQVERAIENSYNKGAYILPVSAEEIAAAVRENRFVAILARDEKGEITFLAACKYTVSDRNFSGQSVIEVGSLISNPNVTTRVEHPTKKLVYLINDGGQIAQGLSYGTGVLRACLTQAGLAYPGSLIIATARSNESRKALAAAGFVRTNWTPEISRRSCDPGCRNIGAKYKNCPLQTVEDAAACWLMVYQK